MIYPVQPEASAIEGVGVTLRRWRGDAGLRQTDLARLIGIEQSHVSAIEREDKTPSVRVLGAWARACKKDAVTVAPRLAAMAGFSEAEIRTLERRLRAEDSVCSEQEAA